MESQPCKVCGGKDLNLVDGFYYCVECGTQDVNVRETIVGQNLRADGTFIGLTTSKKLTRVVKETIDMSGEWKKWHAYNFILAGLTEELLALGARPRVKMIILWIWIRYIKMFQKKEEIQNKTQFGDDTTNESVQGDNDKSGNENSEAGNRANSKQPNTETKKEVKFRRDINVITKGTMLTILYVALNLDRSDIQLSHLFRFIKEGRLSISNCTKFIPKEIDIRTIPEWRKFVTRTEHVPMFIREIAMTFFKRLDLGVPLVPDLTNMIDNYIKELCLPHDFKHLVISLINLFPCDFLKVNAQVKKSIVKVPDYEVVCMSYILVALKMCFGLDGDYEQRLSDEVQKINCAKNMQKAYKLGFYSEMSDRLFSFHEWSQFLQFRKIILSKYYLPMAKMNNLPVDDYVFMEHLGERRPSRKIKISDELSMDILNKINVNNDVSVIPKNQFPVTLTARTTYTDIIIERIQDPDFKLLLSEDFTQYSLKYAINELKFPDSEYSSINIVQGVSKSDKTFNPYVIGTLEVKQVDASMVFVRNCENKNWLKTKPPTVKHVTKIGETQNRSDKDSTSGYDSNLECSPVQNNEIENIENEDLEEERELETFEEEDEGKNIFDDNFIDMDDNDRNPDNIDHQESKVNSVNEILHGEPYNDEESHDVENLYFDPQRFDRDKVLQELIKMACIKYKIPKERKPHKYDKENNKNRKRNLENNEDNDEMQLNAKRTKLRTESRKETRQLVLSYYEKLQNDVLHHISTEVRSFLNITSAANQNESVIAEQTDQNRYNASVISSIHPNTTLNETNIDEEEIEDSFTNINPNFDPKTHNINQLFIKLKDDSYLAENFDFVDDDIDLLLENKINESSSQETTKKDSPYGTSDSEDNIPLSELLEEEMNRLARRKRKELRLEKLLKNEELNEFYYWMRHYKSRAFTRSNDMTNKFDTELVQNCPMSFVFVIRECAAVVNRTPYFLYRHLQTLEQHMMKFKE